MTNSKEHSELLSSIINQKPESINQLHPYALKVYAFFRDEVGALFSQGKLTAEDIELYLSAAERDKLNTYAIEIAEWLNKCTKDSNPQFLDVNFYSPYLHSSMPQFIAVCKTALERKVEKQRQEAEKQAEKQRQEAEKQERVAALKEIDSPLSDAKKYLTPEEEQQFRDEIPGAIDAYLHRNKKLESLSPNLWQVEAYKYNHWVLLIKERKEEERRQKQAQIKHDQYIDGLSAAVEKFKAELSKSKKPKFVYPPELIKYEPEGWCEIYPPNKEQIQKWAESKIFKRLPEILTNLTKWKLDLQSQVVPRAVYEVVDSIPCLTWYFDTHILVTASLELKKCVLIERHPYYTAEVEAEGEMLGVLYLEHSEWLTPGIFTTPIALLSLLAKGDLEAPGITVTEHDYFLTTFAVQGFEEEVEIYDGFREYIAKDKPLAEILLAKGLIDKDTAKLVEEKVKLPLPQVLGTGQAFSDDSDVKGALEGMGYKNGDIDEAMGNAPLSPKMSLEEKVETVLKFLDSNSL